MFPMTLWVRRLLLANIVMFLVVSPGSPFYTLLWLYPPAALVRPWTVFSYMFLHAGLGHLIFNMIGLFFFGPRLEHRLGPRGFLWLYFLSGLGGAAFSFLFAREYPVVGASAAVYGVLLGFAMFWPQERIYIWGILPVPAWLLAGLLVFGSLYAGINPGAASRTAHFAHLGGLAFGFAFLKWWSFKRGQAKREFQRKMAPEAPAPGLVGDRIAMSRWRGIQVETLHELNREEVERLLRKALEEGPASLTPSERAFLDRMTQR
jgi:membrane associated rhomboid family serine protease